MNGREIAVIHNKLSKGGNNMLDLSRVVYEEEKYWIYEVESGYELYRIGATCSTRISQIGIKSDEGLGIAKWWLNHYKENDNKVKSNNEIGASIMISYEEARQVQKELDNKVDKLSKEYRKFERSSNGMCSDEVRATDEYKLVDSEYKKTFKAFQDINKFIMKEYKKEYLKDKREERMRKIGMNK